MPRTLAQKTIKVELEFSISMEELTEEHFPENRSSKEMTHLQHLQQALLMDETALQELMLASVLGKLHEYIDYLTTQDDLESLKRVVNNLSPEDRKFYQKYRSDFFDLTRPLRRTSISAQLNQSEINEHVQGQAEENEWRLIWKDLAQTSELSRNLESMSISFHSSRNTACTEARHHLITRHLTQQTDGVHIEARCTCDAVLEGVGLDEDQAISALWDRFQEHYSRYKEYGVELR